MSKILITNEFSVEALALLKSLHGSEVDAITQRELTREDLADAEALIIRSSTKITADFLQRAPKLRVITTATVGFDHIDLDAAQSRGIVTMHCPSAHTESTAQLAIGHFLTLTRSLLQGDTAVRNQTWRLQIARKDSLETLQLGLVGFGRIGKRVAELAQAFGMQVSAYDPYVDPQVYSDYKVEAKSLIELFKTSDIVSFHVPLTKETYHMVNEKTLEHFNPEAYLVNVSRGGVINEVELAVKMRQGFLQGAAFDVFEKEPLKRESPLQGLPNVVFSPHVGAFTNNSFAKGSMEAARKTIAFLDQGKVSDCLPPETEWGSKLLKNE